MDCPYCRKEMRAGKIPASYDAVRWYEADEEIGYTGGIPLSGRPIVKVKYAKAYHCPDCRMVIIPVPTEEEIEGPMAKLEKKWDAWGERRSQELEQRQAEKDAEKKQQKQEKRRKKDPWEV